MNANHENDRNIEPAKCLCIRIIILTFTEGYLQLLGGSRKKFIVKGISATRRVVVSLSIALILYIVWFLDSSLYMMHCVVF